MKKFLRKVLNNALVKYILRMLLLGVVFYNPNGVTTFQEVFVIGMSLIIFINLMLDLIAIRYNNKLKDNE